jgi:hypothetical protein
MQMPQQPLNLEQMIAQGNFPKAVQMPPGMPPGMNLFVPGYSGPQATAPEVSSDSRFYTEPTVETFTVQPDPVPTAPLPPPAAPTAEVGGLSYYNPQVFQSQTVMPTPVPVAPPMEMPQFAPSAVNNLTAARQAAVQNARSRGRG